MSTAEFFLKNVSTGAQVDLDQPSISVGRADSNDIVLTDGLPSRNHAQIAVADGVVTVEDLGSANGTFINGERIDAGSAVTLAAGDLVRFDVVEFQLVAAAAPVADAEDKTVMRPAVSTAELEAAAAEVVRQREQAAAPAASPASAPAPEPTPERPGAWADPDAAKAVEGRTMLLDRDKLNELMNSGDQGLENLDADVDCPALIITSGGLLGTVFRLEAGSGDAAWSIGSDADCDIVLDESNVSARHAKLSGDNGRWQLSDQMTVNGTFVNGRKCTISYLNSGDRLTFGSVTAVFKLPGKQKKSAAKKSQRGTAAAKDSKGMSNAAIIGIAFVATLAVAGAAYFLLLR